MQRPRTDRIFGSRVPSQRRRATKPAAARQPTAFTEPLEERLMMALSKAGGGSGCSGTLSTNPTIRQQQLICDPDDPAAGSLSVLYNQTFVSLAAAEPGPGYNNDAFQVLVGVQRFNGEFSVNALVTLQEFLDSDGTLPETGFVQIHFSLNEGASGGQISVRDGNTVLDDEGVQGFDTHALYFNELYVRDPNGGDAPPPNAGPTVPYKVFAARAEEVAKFGQGEEDFLITRDGVRIPPTEIEPAVVATNAPPVIDSNGGPYTIDEGSPLHLSGSASRSIGTAGLRYNWDLYNDGTIDATGPSPTLTPAQLAALGLADGPRTVPVRLAVGGGLNTATSFTTLTVNNVNPNITFLSTNAGVVGNVSEGQPVGLTGLFTDPAITDTHKAVINWGDGGLTIINPATSPVSTSHAYAEGGVYDVTLTVTDDDGGSDTRSTRVYVTGSGIHDGVLEVVGTGGADRIDVTTKDTNGDGRDDQVRLYASFLPDRRAYDFGAVRNVYLVGGGGNDKLSVWDTVPADAILQGDDGNDELSGGRRSLLIGGRGADIVAGYTGNDILASGATAYDGNLPALLHILGGTLALTSSTVFDDGEIDSLHGDRGIDVFFLGANDVIRDIYMNRDGPETVVLL
jgi:PKD repeat protein